MCDQRSLLSETHRHLDVSKPGPVLNCQPVAGYLRRENHYCWPKASSSGFTRWKIRLMLIRLSRCALSLDRLESKIRRIAALCGRKDGMVAKKGKLFIVRMRARVQNVLVNKQKDYVSRDLRAVVTKMKKWSTSLSQS